MTTIAIKINYLLVAAASAMKRLINPAIERKARLHYTGPILIRLTRAKLGKLK